MAIHKLIFYSLQEDKGTVLFDDGEININDFFLINLIRATALLGGELHENNNFDLQEMEIGELQIAITTFEEYQYIIVQEALDNEIFTKKILMKLIEKFHSKFLQLDLQTNFSETNTYRAELEEILNTMKFPEEILPVFDDSITTFTEKNDVDVLFLTDLDDGLVKIWKNETIGGTTLNVLCEILSEIHIERSWYGEIMKLDHDGDLEMNNIWFIHRFDQTDFCLCGSITVEVPQRDKMMKELDSLIEELNIFLSENES